MGVETVYKCDVDNVVITDMKFEQFQSGSRTLIICEEHVVNDPGAVKELIASGTADLVDSVKARKDAEIASSIEATK